MVAIILSLLVHALLLYLFTHQRKELEPRPLNQVDDTLNVELNPLSPTKSAVRAASPPKLPTPPAPAQHVTSRPVHRQRVRKAISTVRPVISALKPTPSAPITPQLAPVPNPPETPNTPAPTDMTSYINMIRARKRAASGEGESEAAQPSGEDKRMANIKRNLQPQGGGGIFQIIHVGTESAEFTFRGWDDSTYSNPMRQTIYVQADANTDIEHAVVRKMIAIIRKRHPGDFTWESYRLGRDVLLSARIQDNAGLEDFMLKEFFYENRRPSER